MFDMDTHLKRDLKLPSYFTAFCVWLNCLPQFIINSSFNRSWHVISPFSAHFCPQRVWKLRIMTTECCSAACSTRICTQSVLSSCARESPSSSTHMLLQSQSVCPLQIKNTHVTVNRPSQIVPVRMTWTDIVVQEWTCWTGNTGFSSDIYLFICLSCRNGPDLFSASFQIVASIVSLNNRTDG